MWSSVWDICLIGMAPAVILSGLKMAFYKGPEKPEDSGVWRSIVDVVWGLMVSMFGCLAAGAGLVVGISCAIRQVARLL